MTTAVALVLQDRTTFREQVPGVIERYQRRTARLTRMIEAIGVDDFALPRRHNYATVIIDAFTGRRLDVVEGHRGEVRVVCRDRSSLLWAQVRRVRELFSSTVPTPR